MCGIIGAFNYGEKAEPVNDDVLNILQDQINRGKEGFGISFIQGDRKVETKRATIMAKAIIDLYHEPNQAPMAVMHHRHPTSSENKLSQTHPIVVESGSLKHKYLVIHNGVVRNCDDLRKEHEGELGFQYTTPRMRQWYQSQEEEYNDSESLAIELARFIEGQTEIINVEGSAAFIALQINKKGETVKNVYFGRNEGNPLKLSATRGKIRLSSEGKGENIKPFFLYSFNLKDFKIEKKKMPFKKEEATKEFLPSVDTKDTKVTGFTAYDDDYDKYDTYNKDVPFDLDEVFEDNRIAAEGLLTDYFEALADEQRLLTEDTDGLLKTTLKELMVELREAKDRATDAFTDIFYEDSMKKAEETLARDQELKEEKELEPKYSSK